MQWSPGLPLRQHGACEGFRPAPTHSKAGSIPERARHPASSKSENGYQMGIGVPSAPLAEPKSWNLHHLGGTRGRGVAREQHRVHNAEPWLRWKKSR